MSRGSSSGRSTITGAWSEMRSFGPSFSILSVRPKVGCETMRLLFVIRIGEGNWFHKDPVQFELADECDCAFDLESGDEPLLASNGLTLSSSSLYQSCGWFSNGCSRTFSKGKRLRMADPCSPRYRDLSTAICFSSFSLSSAETSSLSRAQLDRLR